MKYSLPFENPFELPENCVVDFAASNFSEDFDENVRTSFIYLRNIEYTEKIDFSGLSFAQKTRVLELYLNRELRDLTINELDAEIFSCLICSFGQLDTDFFTFQERQDFRDAHQDVLKEIQQFVQSIPLYILSLDRSNIINFSEKDFEQTDSVPSSYQCILRLLSNPIAQMISLLPLEELQYKTTPKFYVKLFYYENAILADAVKTSMFSSIYSEILNSITENDNSKTILSAE